MANNKEAARARRNLKAEGGKRLGPIIVKDPPMWAQILHDQGVLPFWKGKDPTEEQLRAATEKSLFRNGAGNGTGRRPTRYLRARRRFELGRLSASHRQTQRNRLPYPGSPPWCRLVLLARSEERQGPAVHRG